MTVTLETAVRPFRKLRKLFKKFPTEPRPDKVHSLRTQTRRLEATLATLTHGQDASAQKLLKAVTPVRKAAGKVRDLDVHIENVVALRDQDHGDGVIRLVEHLAELRAKKVDRLQTEVARRSSKARRGLKRCSKGIERAIDAKSSAAETDAARLQILTAELEHWPRLTSKNLHAFRIRVKELQYMLQLTPETTKNQLQPLAKVKDSAGEWHDWVELQGIAQEVLDPQVDYRLLTLIKQTVQTKLRRALAEANTLKTRGFHRLVRPFAAGAATPTRTRHPGRRKRASH